MCNSVDWRDFPLFLPIFSEKIAAILIFFSFFFFQKEQLDPKEVIMWKFEDPTSNGLVTTRETNKQTHTHIYTLKPSTR